MNKSLKKDTILKLLSSMSSEKEIRKYLDRFSSDDYRFAVIKVGGAVIQSDLENLVSSLAFLNEVGLRPIIVHGGGLKLSEQLNKRKIEFSFFANRFKVARPNKPKPTSTLRIISNELLPVRLIPS